MMSFDRLRFGVILVVAGALAFGATIRVGDLRDGGTVVATAQTVYGTGTRWNLDARPNDILRVGDRVFVKATNALIEINAQSGAVISKRPLSSASVHGLIASPDQKFLYASDANHSIQIFDITDGLKEKGAVDFPTKQDGESLPTGMAFGSDPNSLYVCLSKQNAVAKVDLGTRTVVEKFPVEPAPFDLQIVDDKMLVSCWGRTPKANDLKMSSAGTPVAIDKNGVSTGGSLCLVDLPSKSLKTFAIGNQPSQIVVSRDGKAYIPCANSDDVEEFDLHAESLSHRKILTAETQAYFGVAPTAIALSPDATQLFVPCGGLNAVAVIDRAKWTTAGWIPTDWYPMGISISQNQLLILNAKGIGSRGKPATEPKKSVYDFTGTINAVSLPITDLARLSQRALEASKELATTSSHGSKVFPEAGKKSVIQHVFYVIKENRTYDQVLGDDPRGDGDPSLTVFGKNITPNIHALAAQFVLLDNFYCNGVLSADGHAWATEGNATSFFERSFGGWSRSYPFGDEPLSPTATGFIWNNVLAHGLTFRNYGEFDYASTKSSFKSLMAHLKAGTKDEFGQNNSTVSMLPYTDRDFPGWNMEIPDEVRASRFIEDFNQRVKNNNVPAFNVVYLPEDHTGASVSAETCVADNDRGLGMVVEAISHSPVWKNSAIFVVEDDPQAGFDHVDGHRSPCLVISPYTKKQTVIHDFYNQSSVLHSIEAIFGLLPMNRMDAFAPIMDACFTARPNLEPFQSLPMMASLAPASPAERLAHLDVSKPDLIDEDQANRLLWSTLKPGRRYPAEFAGAHGTGLLVRGLKLAERVERD